MARLLSGSNKSCFAWFALSLPLSLCVTQTEMSSAHVTVVVQRESEEAFEDVRRWRTASEISIDFSTGVIVVPVISAQLDTIHCVTNRIDQYWNKGGGAVTLNATNSGVCPKYCWAGFCLWFWHNMVPLTPSQTTVSITLEVKTRNGKIRVGSLNVAKICSWC